jgi:hypothetical protein
MWITRSNSLRGYSLFENAPSSHNMCADFRALARGPSVAKNPQSEGKGLGTPSLGISPDP